ncbi:ABC transporter ATP-binding protein [Tepidiforma sp.]|uniref:ABC transporter ATP-binding protein n=1 Tax=Tepidiforma sp. TaxID=2682230 RepID=UPI002ADDA254|nr:ABC transporter ATP-binding protein [Tepidiforma sp.]
MPQPLLEVIDLDVQYRTRDGAVHALSGVSLRLEPGQVLAVVGESGSGKTTLASAIPRLLPQQAAVSGAVRFQGTDLLQLPERDLRPYRGRRIAMVFQDPIAGLNPVLDIGSQVAEILTSHLPLGRREARERAIDILASVGLHDPERIARAYPFQLSGGMCQRVMIAIATALDPDLLIADEPTSALDVTVQAQILAQLETLRERRGTAILLITHDFGVVARIADAVAVMYAGRIVEEGPVRDLLRSPLHPYSRALLDTLPRLDAPREALHQIPGHPPDLATPAERCPYLPRCSKALSRCRQEPAPGLEQPGGATHRVACYNPVWQDLPTA